MLAELIREAAKQCVSEEVHDELIFGTVTQCAPLTVTIENKLVLQGNYLILPKELERREISLTFADETKTVVLFPGLQTGDSVALVRMGDYFLIAGRINLGK